MIPKFINGNVKYDNIGQYIWIVEKDGNHKKLADVRGYRSIQQLCKKDDGTIDIDKADKMQDEIGEWIVSAINEKIYNDANQRIPIGRTRQVYTNGKSLFTLEDFSKNAGVSHIHGVKLHKVMSIGKIREMHENGKLFYVFGNGDRKQIKGLQMKKGMSFNGLTIS